MKELLNHLKSSAKKRNIEFSITIDDLNNLSFPLVCPILSIPLAFNRNAAEDNSFSVDRVDSTKGYVKDNLVVISQKANRMKNNGTLKELEQMVEFYKNLE